MTSKVLNNNLIFLYPESGSPSLEQISQIEVKITSIYEGITPKPVITKFPDFTAILIPEAQVSIVIQKDKLVVTDQMIGDFARKDVLKFIQLTKAILEVLNKQILSYGYNFIYELEANNFNFFSNKLKLKFIKTSLARSLPDGATLKYILPTLVFERENAKYIIKFSALADNPESLESKRLSVNCNVHHNQSAIPAIAALHESYNNTQAYINTYLGQLFR